MRSRPRRAVGTIATAATVLLGSAVESAPSGQARGTLNVTVQVVAACGGSAGAAGNASLTGCAVGSGPVAVLTESASATPADSQAATAARIEASGEVRYVTLIY